MNIDPQLIDPDLLDFRIQDGSPAKGYGCETFYIPDKTIKHLKQYRNVLSGGVVSLSGNINENTLVTADTVFVTDHIVINNNVTLKFSPGTLISFTGPFNIVVDGTLISEGTAAERIIFTSLKQDDYNDYINHTFSWSGIIFNNTLSTNDSSSIKYSILEYAKSINSSTELMTNNMGGAIFISNFSKLTIENNIFRFNTALYGAAMAAVNNCQPQINNNLFYDNYALYNGSVAYLVNSYPYFYNNTLVYNTISDLNPDYQMGAIYCFRSKPLLVNNIIRENRTGAFPQVYFYKEYFMHNNNIKNLALLNGNFDSDPLFDKTQELPGVLLEGSPCVDAGTDMELMQPEFDLIGNPRISNGIIDVGAFEVQAGNSIDILPAKADLLQIYPNPSNPDTRISFEAEIDCAAEILIYDLKGNVLEKINQIKSVKGRNSYDIKLDKYVSGMYIIRVALPGKIVQGKFLLVK